MSGIDLSKYSKSKNKGNPVGGTSTNEASGLAKLLQTEIKLFDKKFDAKQKEWLYAELGMLIAAGVDIKTTFEIIEQETQNKKHKELIISIKEAIIKGESIHEVFANYASIFTNYEIQSLKIGEETGKLSEVFTELGKFYNSAIKLRRQIIGTLTYPIIVIGLAMSIVYFMISFVVPMFNDIFKQTGGQLPEATKLLIKISNNSSLIFYTVAGIILGFVILHKTQNKKQWYRKFTSELFLKVPVVNNLIKKIYLARFCQSMRLLISAKVLFTDALALAESMIGYYPIEKAIRQAKEDVIKGSSLHQSMVKHSIFPSKLIALIKVSEEVNAPELIFEKLEKQYFEEIEHQQALVGKVIEPFIIIVLGLIIGFILVAMYLPMFQISNGF